MKSERMNQTLKTRELISCILIIIMTAFALIPLSAFASENKVIRVGYDSNSNFIKESDGQYYGYGVEYLEKIAEYTGWKYEYVYGEKSELYDDLQKGNIDIMAGVPLAQEENSISAARRRAVTLIILLVFFIA